MIVQRMTWKVKRGCMQELLALRSSFIETTGLTVRRYTPRVGRHDTLVEDHEFESLAEMERFWEEWGGEATQGVVSQGYAGSTKEASSLGLVRSRCQSS